MIDVDGGNTVYYYHFDGLGSVAALSDVNNVIVEQYSYDVFGAPTIYDVNSSEISQSAIGNPYMFTARRADDETALYYYRARYYAFDIGRFLQTDPIGYFGGLNLYSYCGNNPLNWIDPLGNITISVGGGGLLGGGLSGQTQEGYAIDSSGNIGYYETKGLGTGTPSAGAFVAVGGTWAEQITDLSGLGGLTGGSVGPLLSGGAEVVFFPIYPSQEKTYIGGELSFGASLVPVEVHGQVTYTKVNTFLNVKDIYKNPKAAAKGYLDLQLHVQKKRTYLDEIYNIFKLLKYFITDKESEEKCKCS